MSIRIERVEFVGLRSPLEPPARFSWGTAEARNVGLVRIELDDGTEGWGETSVTFPLWSLEERAATVSQGLAMLFQGRICESIEDVRVLVAEVDAATTRLRSLWAPVAISAGIAAIEMALLDALAVRAGLPLWQMLGGEPFDVPLYAVGFTGSPEQAAVQAQAAIEEGYSAVKVRLGFGMQADLELLTAFRETLGSAGTILADVNMGWSVEQALEMLPLLEDFDLGWLEEPVGRMDLAGLAAIGQRTKMPLAAGENCYSLEEARVLINARAVNVFMPDIARLGGLLNSIVAVQRAQSAGLDYSPHHYASDIGFSGMLTLCAVMGPSRPILRDITPWDLRHEVLLEPVALSDGTARVSNEPGIGPRPSMATIERYRVL